MISRSKKILLVLFVICMIFSGCEKNETGEVTEVTNSIYYKDVSYYNERFDAEIIEELDSGYRVHIESGESEGDFYESPAGSCFDVTLTKDEYDSLIGDKPVFEATFRVMVVIDGNTIYAGFVDDDSETGPAIRKVLTEDNIQNIQDAGTEDFITDYIKKNKMIYLEL